MASDLICRGTAARPNGATATTRERTAGRSSLPEAARGRGSIGEGVWLGGQAVWLGRPAYVCPRHVRTLPCGHKGTKISDYQALKNWKSEVCSECGRRRRWWHRAFRLVRLAELDRKCSQGCYHVAEQ